MKFYRHTEDTSGLLYRQYHRLIRTGTYLNFGMKFSFLINFTVDFRTIFKFYVLKKLNLFVCRCTNGIKGILMELFYYSSSQCMKLN